MSETRLKLFGTDGVRGTANKHPMTPQMALALGQAIAYVFRGRGGDRHQVMIAKDTRLSGYLFEDALAAGISSMGVNVIQVGPMPRSSSSPVMKRRPRLWPGRSIWSPIARMCRSRCMPRQRQCSRDSRPFLTCVACHSFAMCSARPCVCIHQCR